MDTPREKKPTKDGLLSNFENLLKSRPEFDKKWFSFMKERFLISKIGLYCLQNQISAEDLIQTLQKMPFDDYFTLMSGHASMKTAYKGHQMQVEWYGFKDNKENQILDDFKANLPPVTERTPYIEPLPPPKKEPPLVKPTPPPLMPRRRKEAAIPKTEMPAKSEMSLSKDNLIKLKNNFTKDSLMENFEKLLPEHPELDKRWFDYIKDHFMTSKIGFYCVQNHIPAENLIQAVNKMSFDDFFEEKSGKGKIRGMRDSEFRTTWEAFKPGMQEQIIDIFKSKLPVENQVNQVPPSGMQPK